MLRFLSLADRPWGIDYGRARLLGMCLCLGLAGCQSILLTGHASLDLLPEEQEMAFGIKAYQEVLQTEPKSQNAHLSQILERVGRRISVVSERPDYQWEFTLLSGSAETAFCLPGGKVAVHEGILPICANEAGLAVVVSHEIAHALARHGGERITHQMSAQSGEWALSRMLDKQDAKHVETVKTAYGLRTPHGPLLPFSRQQEAEADSIGLLLMARAGYDPQEAPRFWNRLRQSSSTNAPQLLSTHPSDATRGTKLAESVPRAMSFYQSASQRHGLGEQIPMPALAERVPTAAPALAPLAEEEIAATSLTAIPDPDPAVARLGPAASDASTIGAITVAPAPIIHSAETEAEEEAETEDSPSVATDAAWWCPEFEAATNEGTHSRSVPASIVTASAEAISASDLIIPALATGTSRPPEPVAQSPLGPAPPWAEVPADDSPDLEPGVFDGWKPHVE